MEGAGSAICDPDCENRPSDDADRKVVPYRLLNSGAILVADLTRAIAQRAGQLLARNKLSSAHAVDAFVVATAAQYERAVIATADTAGIRRLAASTRSIRILSL
jgi:hypothetical protein